jgi:hypothetical protein
VLAIASNDEIHRFDPSGAEITPTWSAPSGVSSMSFDATGDLVVLSAVSQNGAGFGGTPVLSELSPSAATLFSVTLPEDPNNPLGDGIVLALPSGQIAALRRHYGAYSSTLDEVELYDGAGMLVWGLRKGLDWTTGDYNFPFGFSGQLIANPSGGFRVAGTYFQGSTVVESFMP